jgi:hypothetical protein
MRKHERRRLAKPSVSTGTLLDLAYRRLQESQQVLRNFWRNMQAVDDACQRRVWSGSVSVLNDIAIIAQRDYISRLPLGSLPADHLLFVHGRVSEGSHWFGD